MSLWFPIAYKLNLEQCVQIMLCVWLRMRAWARNIVVYYTFTRPICSETDFVAIGVHLQLHLYIMAIFMCVYVGFVQINFMMAYRANYYLRALGVNVCELCTMSMTTIVGQWASQLHNTIGLTISFAQKQLKFNKIYVTQMSQNDWRNTNTEKERRAQ